MKRNLIKNSKGTMAMSQIFLLIVGIVAIGYAVGGSVGIVSGAGYPENPQKGDLITDGAGVSWAWYNNEWNGFDVENDKEATLGYVEMGKVFNAPDMNFKYSPSLSGGDSGWVHDSGAGIWVNSETGVITDTPPSRFNSGSTKKVEEAAIVPTASSVLPSLVGKKSVSISTGYGVNYQGALNHYQGEIYTITEKGGEISYVNINDVTGASVDGVWAGYGTGFLGNLAQGVTWSLGLVAAIQTLGPILTDDKSLLDSLTLAGIGGIMVSQALTGAGEQWNFASGLTSEIGGVSYANLIGAAVALYIIYDQYREEETKTVIFNCYPWDAPVGGNDCEKCNKQGDLPCSEYQCRSLGQACELQNVGTSEELCTWVNPNDINPPTIQPWEDALLEGYSYSQMITFPNKKDVGVEILNDNKKKKCVEAFTPLSFGINTDEPAKCKLDYIRKDNFDEMQFFFGGSSTSKYNHSEVMSLPGPSALAAENLTIQNDGNFDLYVRCQDANGNKNVANFVFKFCVDKGPDTQAPVISASEILNGMPIAYNTRFVPIEIYTNEPAQCRWSHRDQSYENMEEEMDNSKADSIKDINSKTGLYTLKTTLTSLRDKTENKFYFRCNDTSGNTNQQSYEFSLIGTRPLVIDSVFPNGTIKDSVSPAKITLEARTSAGYKDGEATCQFGSAEDGLVIDKFLTPWTYEHSYDLWLTEGDYKYFINCFDLGGNSDTKNVSFSVEIDNAEPLVVRAYHEDVYLKVITNEKANCVYNTQDKLGCNYGFEDGIKMQAVDKTDHFTDWDTRESFYIKCEDEYGNPPLPNECNIVVKPFEIDG